MKLKHWWDDITTQIKELHSMSHFAKVVNGIVQQIIVAEQDVIDSGMFGTGWIQTSYNTRGGIHYDINGQVDSGHALRANYAGIGDVYDPTNDVFYAPQPYSSWTISAPTWLWVPPTPYPTDTKDYYWDEPTLSWVEIK